MLIGESAEPALVDKVWQILVEQPEIIAVNHVRTIHIAPDAVFVAISADCDDALPMGRAEMLIEEIEARMKAAVPALTSIYIRPEKSEHAVRQTRPIIR